MIVNVFIFDEDRFLMIRRTETAPFKPGAWDIPGGEVEPREAPLAAAVREAREETQLKVDNLLLVPKHPKSRRQYFVTDEFSGTIEFLPNLEHLSSIEEREYREDPQRFEGDERVFYEHDDYQWVTFEEYQRIPNKTITNEKNVLEAMKVLGMPLPPPYDTLMENKK